MARLRLFLAVQLVCLVHSLVLGQYSSYNYGFDISSRVKRQLAQRRMVVVNEKTGSAIQVRQEIRQLEQDKDLWTLYILGLSMMQFTDQSSPTSWYGITGLRHPLFPSTSHYRDESFSHRLRLLWRFADCLSQGYTACPTKLGAALDRLVIPRLGIVPIRRSYFRRGIGLIWLCTR